MIRTVVLIFLLILTACGPSQEEIENTAIITCNIMGESRNMDAAMRIREINAAREKIGAAPFLKTDDAIKESFEYGLCEELVKDDPEYQIKLLAIKKLLLEAELAAAEKKQKEAARAEEALRQKREREAIERAERRAQEAERQRIRREKAAEAKRQKEIKRIERELAYKEKVEEYLQLVGEVPSILSIKTDKVQKRITTRLACSPRLNGIDYDLVLTFAGEKHLRVSDSFYYCRGFAYSTVFDIADRFFFESPSLIDDLVSAELEVRKLDTRHIPKELNIDDVNTLDPAAFDLPTDGLRQEQRVVVKLQIHNKVSHQNP